MSSRSASKDESVQDQVKGQRRRQVREKEDPQLWNTSQMNLSILSRAMMAGEAALNGRMKS